MKIRIHESEITRDGFECHTDRCDDSYNVARRSITFTTNSPEKYLLGMRQEKAIDFELNFTDASAEFFGYVRSVVIDGRFGKVQIEATGGPMKLTKIDVTKHGAKTAPTPRSHRYYVASPNAWKNSEAAVRNGVLGRSPVDASPSWAKESYAETKEHARRMLAADPDLKEVVVVKVVRIIRRRHKLLPIREEKIG